MSDVELTVGGTGLEFDRDYGIDRRTGWSVLHRGSVVVQFVCFPRAVWRLLKCLATGRPL